MPDSSEKETAVLEEKPGRRSSAKLPLKVLAIAACGMLLGIGFCGLDAHLYPRSEFGGSSLAGIGTILIVVSAAGLVVAGIWLLVLGVKRLLAK